MSTGYKVIGSRPIRHDGLDKVTGRALYGADFQIAGLLHGRILRSPFAHANIKKIDVSAALKVPGVEAVATGADLPDPGERVANLGEGAIVLRHLSSNCLARGKALYHGQAIAAVAATSPHVAEEALALIKVEYEPLPPIMDVRKAMEPGAPILLPDLVTEGLGEGNGAAKKPTNIAKHFQFKMGDTAEGFKQAAVVVERVFHTATVHQGYIEPHNATALWNADGTLTIWCSTQGAFTVRAQVAELMQIPVSRIKVVPMEIGGGFGGKIRVYLEPVAALLSKKTGRPVKVLMNRADVFAGTGPTPGSYIKVKLGADKSGRLTAGEAYLAYEAGAFPGSPVGPGAMCIFAAYDIPNQLIDGFDVCVNKPATSAYRAPGATNAAFAAETVVDEICETLKIDPLEFRLKNGAKEGTRRADGPVYPRIGMLETVQTAKKHPHYTAPLASPLTPHPSPLPRGRGVATGFWFNVGLKSSCAANVNPDGTVSLVEGSTDIGGTRTAVAMQLAEALGLRAEDVRPTVADTDSVGYTDVTGGSRVAYATGWAAYEAAQDIKRQMLDKVAQLWEMKPDDLDYQDGAVVSKKDPTKKMTFKEVAEATQKHGGGIVGRASIDPPWPGGAFATHIVDVEVDPDTGKVQILRYTAVQDCGKAIHPSYVEGQIQGGAVQGIGWALNEEYFYNAKGELMNASYLDYRMPTSLDLPMIEPVIVEVPDPNHPYGVRGVGEVPIVPPPAAIANAIYKAIGVRMDVLPMSPGRVVKRIVAGKK